MNTQIKRLALAAVLVAGLGYQGLFAQSTMITYQGLVQSSGAAFTGHGQFKFALVTSTNSAATATAVATVSGGFVTIVSLTSLGSGYVTPPTVTFLGGGGSGAVATAALSGGQVTVITVNNPGSGYTTTPAVILSAPPPAITYPASHWSNDGTSSAGSEPATAVTIPVSGGLLSVGLGDTTVPGMAALDAALFQQPNLQLRIWFNDGVHGFAALNPAQRLTPAPYAAHAITAGGLAGASNQPVSLVVNGVPALRLEDNGAGGPNVIGGSPVNTVADGVVGATISGGGGTNYGGSFTNRVTADFGTVGGGAGNISSSLSATVGGGSQNTSSGGFGTVGGGIFNASSAESATVGGGSQNTSSGVYGTVGGGTFNTSSGWYATVGGGTGNTSSGNAATVPGGYLSQALGNVSFAAGNRARAIHDHSFVWSSYQETSPSFATNTFFINAPNGLGINCGIQRPDGGGEYWMNFGRIAAGGPMIETSVGASLSLGGVWQNASDQRRKTDFEEVNTRAVLEKVAALPVRQWRYTNEMVGVTHLGPTAQAFKAAFGLGEGETTIGTVDADGVALAAIQGLNRKVEAGEAALRTELQQKETEIAKLKERLEALEKIVFNQRQAN